MFSSVNLNKIEFHLSLSTHSQIPNDYSVLYRETHIFWSQIHIPIALLQLLPTAQLAISNLLPTLPTSYFAQAPPNISDELCVYILPMRQSWQLLWEQMG